MVVLSIAETKSTLNKIRAFGVFIMDEDDIQQDAALLTLENPTLDASKIVAILVQRAKQSRSTSIVCGESLSPKGDGFDPFDRLPICSCFDSRDDGLDLAKWRTASDKEIVAAGGPTNPENFRFEITGRRGQQVTERRQRQKIQKMTQEFTNRQCSIFDSVEVAARRGTAA